MLPDDVLLKVFDFYVEQDMVQIFEKTRIEEWITLAHVCRRWRSVVFQSPRRLNLRLLCTSKTRVRDSLDIWPPLPLAIHAVDGERPGLYNIIAALEHNDRVCQIKLATQSSELEYFMHKSFPELTHLLIGMYNYDGGMPKIPDSFLGGTAPRLRSLRLGGVPFPGLPNLLLSTTHLVHLDVHFIPRTGYIPPEAITNSLSGLTSLEYLRLEFRYPRPRPVIDSRRSPPPTRSILPRLTKILFQGVSDYLEEMLTRIDTPQLEELCIGFFHQSIFDTPQLLQFISRRPTLRAPERGHIEFHSQHIIIKFSSQTSHYDVLSVRIGSMPSERQLSSLKQVCASSLPPLSTLEDLYISEDPQWRSRWQGSFENTLWLELLHLFATVKNLYLAKEFVPRIAPNLQELVGGRATEVLPSLMNILLEGFQPPGPLHEGIERFVAARLLTGHPVAVSRWEL